MNLYLESILTSTLVAAFLAASAIVAAQTVAPAAPRPEAVIKWRQSVFQVIAWNSGRIKAATEGPYDKAEVAKAANTIAALSSDLSRLFPPGTEQGKGWRDTSVKAEAFTDTKRFTDLASALSKEATELSRVAGTGDAPAAKQQFAKVQRSCKTCHDAFRRDDY
jgi:cytochrome c556